MNQNVLATHVIPGKGTLVLGELAEFMRLRRATPGVPSVQADCFALRPGTCVKTYDDMLRVLVPKLGGQVIGRIPVCGIMHKNTVEECVVIGHGVMPSSCETFIWRGTPTELRNVWVID